MTTATTVRNCAVCGSALGETLLRIAKPDRFEVSVGIPEEGYSRMWVRCTGCGAASNVHDPVNHERFREISASYYEVDFKGSSIAEKYAKVMSMPAEKSDNAQRVKRIREFLGHRLGGGPPAGMRALDIGAGTGVFLSRFLQENPAGSWTAVGVEPDPHAVAHLRSLGLFQVVHDIYRGQPELAGFDLCTLNKIVEHVEEPVALLRSTLAALKPDSGILYVELPDVSTIAYRPPEDNILGALHYHLYDIGSAARLLEASGYEPLRVTKLFEPSGKISVAAFAIPAGATARLLKGGKAHPLW